MRASGPSRKCCNATSSSEPRFLRCYRIANDARKIVNDVRYQHLPEFRKRDREDIAQARPVPGFRSLRNGDPSVARELEKFISLQCGTAARADRLEATLKEVDRQLATIFHEMEEYNADFEALEEIDRSRLVVFPAELEELRCLLGQYGVDLEKRLPAGRATVCARQRTPAGVE